MIGCIREKICFLLVKEGASSTVALCEYDFVEEFDLGIFCAYALALMYKLVEGLCLLQRSNVRDIFAG